MGSKKYEYVDRTFQDAWQPTDYSTSSFKADRQRQKAIQYQARRRNNDPAQAVATRQYQEAAQLSHQPVIEVSRHSFIPPLTFSKPQSHDPILNLAKPVLGTHSYKTFAGYCNPLFIEPLFSCDVGYIINTINAGGSVVAMYAIGRYGLMVKVPLTINPRNDKQVLVQVGDVCMDLGEWLETLPASVTKEAMPSDRAIRVQHEWWMENGKNFPIMNLPSELRCHIMQFAFGHDVYPNSKSPFGEGSRKQEGYIDVFSTYNPTLKHADTPTTAVLLLNKTINEEMQTFVQIMTRKCFGSSTACSDYMVNPSPAVLAKLPTEHLQTVELCLTNAEYIQFFGVAVPPFSDGNMIDGTLWQMAAHLGGLTDLKHLFLRFRSPIFAGDDDPWGETGQFNGHGLHTDWKGNERYYGYETSCQKVLLDWILTYAFDYIKCLPKVTLCGYIKDSTKAKWEGMLQDEKNGIHHDMTQPKHMIDLWRFSNDYGPSCYCTNTCYSICTNAYPTGVLEYIKHQPSPLEVHAGGKIKWRFDSYYFDFND